MHTSTDGVNQATAISKSQLKKQRRRQKWLNTRDERRKLEKEKKKAKRKEQAQQKKELANEGIFIPGYKRPKLMSDSNNKFRIVIDMNFNDLMTEPEVSKAVQQVGRIYAMNRHSDNPCQLYVSSLKGAIKDKFYATNTGCTNWDINYSESDYVELFKKDSNGTDKKPSEKFIYLTGDADASLPTVEDILRDESRIFIIGGLVDHNRHKNLCHRRATERGIPTAKLPIKEYVNLCQRHILSTVTVFEILLNVLGYRQDWPEALKSSIPKRKITQPLEDGVAKVDNNSKKSMKTSCDN